MNNSVKAVFLDIDGTLIYKDEGPFPADIAAIEKARGRGHRFFLCTGRALSNIPPLLRNAPWVDGIAAATGTHVMIRSNPELPGVFTTLASRVIPEDIIKIVIDYFYPLGIWCALEGEDELYLVNEEEPRLFARHPVPLTRENNFLSYCRGLRISKLTMQGDASQGERTVLGPYFNLHALGGYHEGVLKGESKSGGIERILAALGLKQEDSIAIGDSANDLDMIRFAGRGIAMGNACEELKQAADEITTGVRDGGVAHVLARLPD
jgi:hydroxymethylpyrimidine pyrophosphatase-like HAD family hydrolase